MTKQLSKRAAALLLRVHNQNRFYKVQAGPTPPAMQELIDAGLVVIGGRVNVICSAYIPKGTKPFRMEQFPGEKPRHDGPAGVD